MYKCTIDRPDSDREDTEDVQSQVMAATSSSSSSPSTFVLSPYIHESEKDETIKRIRIKPPKCFTKDGGSPHWERLLSSFKQHRDSYKVMTYCRSHYCARMRVHTYHGFIQLFAEFAGDNFDEQAVRVLLTTYKEFDDMHLALLNRNIDDITKRICADGRQLVVTYPLQVAFAEQIRTIFPVCQSEHTPVNMRILGQNVSRYLNFHDLPIFRDEEYIFDILWKYSAKSSPISIYANNVLDHLVRVLKEGFFRIAQCMVLFFVYTLKMVCKLVEYNVTIQLEALSSRAPETSENEINTRAEQRYCMQICDQLNAKLIGVFKEFVDIVGAATTTNTYERQLNEEQIRHHTPTLPAASSSSALLDTVTMEGGEEEQKSNCTLS